MADFELVAPSALVPIGASTRAFGTRRQYSKTLRHNPTNPAAIPKFKDSLRDLG